MSAFATSSLWSRCQPLELSECVDMRPKIVGQHTEYIRSILRKCPRLYGEYQKPPWLFNNHVETIWGAWFRSGVRLELDREVVGMKDGGVVTLDTLKTETPLDADAPVLLMMPGLAGGSDSVYVRHAIQSAHEAGMRPICFNSRGMASSPVTTAQFYSASYTEDLRAVVRHIHDRYPDAHVCAVGWSLGANILVNYLGEEGSESTLLSAVSLCNPFNLPICDQNFQAGFSRVYSANLAISMKTQFRKHMHLFTDYDSETAMSVQTVREIDDLITRVTFGPETLPSGGDSQFPCLGWESVDAYYKGSSSANRVGSVGIPLLCIQAEDDPICLAAGIPREAIEQNENCVLVTTPHGGHLGWLTTEDGVFGAPWTDKTTLEWLSAVLQNAGPKSNGQLTELSLCGSSSLCPE